MPVTRRELLGGTAAAAAAGAVGVVVGKAISGDGDGGTSPNGTPVPGGGGAIDDVIAARGLSPDDAVRAVKTYVPGAKSDEFFIISSGGHSGQLFVIGVPSMRLLKAIGVFTPESWQGWGFGADAGMQVLASGTDIATKGKGPELKWADTHHPGISETGGEYDGRWVYVNDRANGRIAMVDLRDFKTKQIVDIPHLQTSHGGVFVTPNSEYAHISTMTPTLLPGADPAAAVESVDNYAASFRGYSTWCKIDPGNGHLDMSKSFQVELPPYTQDLADAGKLVSDGWGFINSYNSEMAAGGILDGRPAIEVGASQNDFDFLHIINWKKAEEVVAAGKAEDREGIKVIPLDTAVAEGILFLAPEPKSPHGVDVAPNGQYICVGGKLSTLGTVYSIDKIKTAIENKDFEGNDRFGVPILKFDSVMVAQVELGAGPLHTQFDDKGYAYTSMFLDSAVSKWSLGEPYFTGDQAWKLVEKLPVNYNIGHICAMEGDTVKPAGKYVVALNKWSIDRFPVVGTLKPQNFQLVDLSGETMDILYDSPIGVGEPHYVQAIRADRIKAWEVYPPGTNPLTMQPDPDAVTDGAERIERNGNTVEVWGTIKRSHFTPDLVRAKVGDKIIFHMTNTETTPDATHGFAIPRLNINASFDPGEHANIEVTPEEPGAYAYYCTEFCSALHLEMQGWIVVENA